MDSLNIRLEVFEGPFDLLYHLITKKEIDIYDIPISEITDQYLEYLSDSSKINPENISEFILMAATLIEIKSKMLLPSKEDEDEKDPREELVQKLIEYKKYKEAAKAFNENFSSASKIFYKQPEFIKHEIKASEDISGSLSGVTVEEIFKAFKEVLKRKELKTDKIRSGFKTIYRDLYSVEDKMKYIKNLLVLTPKLYFSEIFLEDTEKAEVITTFLALLELIKLKDVIVYQKNIFEEILIAKNNEV
ncbi:MAG: segregation/condensation protein A [Lachnospiraceae bacterium]|nr:segregation/condensation protein A [Lachnospiraceae bacterium]